MPSEAAKSAACASAAVAASGGGHLGRLGSGQRGRRGTDRLLGGGNFLRGGSVSAAGTRAGHPKLVLRSPAGRDRLHFRCGWLDSVRERIEGLSDRPDDPSDDFGGVRGHLQQTAAVVAAAVGGLVDQLAQPAQSVPGRQQRVRCPIESGRALRHCLLSGRPRLCYHSLLLGCDRRGRCGSRDRGRVYGGRSRRCGSGQRGGDNTGRAEQDGDRRAQAGGGNGHGDLNEYPKTGRAPTNG
jgi:hypothetical protein